MATVLIRGEVDAATAPELEQGLITQRRRVATASGAARPSGGSLLAVNCSDPRINDVPIDVGERRIFGLRPDTEQGLEFSLR